MTAPRRNPLNWLWVAVPPAVTLLGGALLLAYGGPVLLPFVLANVVVHGANFAVNELRRREDGPARPAWEFHRPFREGCAGVGRLFAVGSVLLAGAPLAGAGPVVTAGALAAAAALYATGVRGLSRLVRGTPTVRLTGDGVAVGSRTYRWDGVERVELNGDRWHPRIDLQVVGRPRPVTVRPEDVDGSLLFLLDLIGYYVAHPARRPSIGAPAEAVRVHAALLGARLSAGLAGGPTPIPAH
ncbi:hypothetical protein Daura_03625 [Dactylosporangium aurantiacum]|uniref:Uncharacterized protein n=1 Tax=Dactylosporangium aurantiacum TaxID=35754 RepID=A0A9Q9IJN8_9ACTN|nr:hypothetical protein [Dactylosporangium aurantiacum]MDG6100549.1 hypothetical protein [Dactylosporangium aurantiacum]UWZ55355.1 hypothetical protein Daura_03625 [Dactylosporangium aurantiacum]